MLFSSRLISYTTLLVGCGMLFSYFVIFYYFHDFGLSSFAFSVDCSNFAVHVDNYNLNFTPDMIQVRLYIHPVADKLNADSADLK
jgi:hypothetical protein